MTAVVIAVLLAAVAGIGSECRWPRTLHLSRWTLKAILFVEVPFVSFVNVAHIRVTVGNAAGLAIAYPAVGCAGLAAWMVGKRLLHLSRPELGAMINSVVIVNTGYLGLPMAVALLGPGALGPAIEYDQLVSAPILFLGAFAVASAFGDAHGGGVWPRARRIVTRNPPLWAVVAGLLAPATLAPHVLVSASRTLVTAVLPIGFFAVGAHLAASAPGPDIRRLLLAPDRRVIAAVALRLSVASSVLLLPAAAGLSLPNAYLLQAAMPTGINSLVLAHVFGLDRGLAAMAIIWTTLAVLGLGLVSAAV